MSVAPDREPLDALLPREGRELDVQVLPRHRRVELQRLALDGRLGEHAAPVGDQAEPPAVHPGLRVREHVQPRLPERGEVALGLVLLRSQLGVERAEHQVEARERVVVHVDRAVGEQIDLHRAEHAERVALLFERAVHRVDDAALLRELGGRHAVRDHERL